MKSSLLISLLVTLTTFPSYSQVNFEDLSFTDAIAKASNEGKYVFLDFRADWCKPCIEMEQTTFQDTAVGNYLTQKAVSLKVDVDLFTGMDIKEMYNVNQYPTMLVLDPYDSSVLLRMIGFKPASIILGDLKFVMDMTEVEDTTGTTDAPTETNLAPDKKCFLRRWLDRITE